MGLVSGGRCVAALGGCWVLGGGRWVGLAVVCGEPLVF